MVGGFDARGLLEQMLGTGREYAQKGEDLAAEKLGIGDDAESRGDFRKGIVGGAVGAGVLGLLLGTSTGRTVGALGGLAVLGKLAYDRWQTQEGGAHDTDAAPPIDRLAAPEAEARARTLLIAMIAAAKADGHVDEAERRLIEQKLAPLGSEATAFLFDELARTRPPEEIAALAGDPQSGAEIYAISAYVCGRPGPEEQDHLDRLGDALNLAVGTRRAIEEDVRSV